MPYVRKDWFKCTRPEHPAHGGVMLCTVQCRPASACARKSPPRGCTLKKQDKTRQDKIIWQCTKGDVRFRKLESKVASELS